MSIPPALFAQVFTRKLFAFSGSTLLYYDYLLTFSHEVAHIWHGQWTLVKALFLINRYGNLIGQTFIMLEETGYITHNSQKFCADFEIFCASFAVFSGESIRLLVVMRACAILGCKRNVTMLVTVIYALSAVVVLVVSSEVFTRNFESSQFPHLDVIGVCFALLSSNAWLLFFIPLFVDNIVLAIMCYSLHRATRWSGGSGPSQLIRLLLRDAFLFYFVALFNVLFFMSFWKVYQLDPRNTIPTAFSYPILSAVGQRVVLNLRRFQSRPHTTCDVSREVRRQVVAMGEMGLDHSLDLGMELDELEGKPRMPMALMSRLHLGTNEVD